MRAGARLNLPEPDPRTIRRTPRVSVVRGTYQINVPELGIYAQLAQHGFAPELIAPRRCALDDHEAGMPVRRLAVPRLAGRISRTLAGGYLLGRVSPYRYFHEYLRGLPQALKQTDVAIPVDLGHPTSHQCLEAEPRPKVVVQVWDNIPFNWPEDRPLARHYEEVLEQADHFLALTDDADRALRLQGVETSRRSRVNIGIDLEEFRPPSVEEARRARQDLGVGPEEVVFAFLGRVEFWKGIFTLLEALGLIQVPLRLLVVGGGAGLSRARWLSRKLRLESRVFFRGPVPHAELQPRVLWGIDGVVIPSIPTPQWREQFGQAFLEAMAVGLPVIGSRTGAVPELVQDGVTGLLVPPDSPEDLRRALEELGSDGDLRRRYGQAGRRWAESRYNVGGQAATLAAILKRKVLLDP
jgi:glycosyltransferase involved in cell wall biosynthesis